VSRISYPLKLMEECLEDVSRRGKCVHYSLMKGKCTRRWAGRTPGNPCECFRERTRRVE